MKTMRGLLVLIFLVAGVLVGTILAQGRAVAGEPSGVVPLSVNTGALLIRASEMFSLRAASVDNHPGEAVSLSNFVRVLEPQAAENQVAAVGAATRLLLMPEDEQVFLPLLTR